MLRITSYNVCYTKLLRPQLQFEPIFGEDLDPPAREALAARIRARPNDYIAQELVQLSQAPVWDTQARANRLSARAMGLRVS